MRINYSSGDGEGTLDAWGFAVGDADDFADALGEAFAELSGFLLFIGSVDWLFLFPELFFPGMIKIARVSDILSFFLIITA